MMQRAGSIEKVAVIIENEYGLFYPPNRYDDLIRGLSATALLAYGERDSSLIISNILQNGSVPADISEELISSLTITETYFFRESPSILLFVNKIIPVIKERGAEFNIWSAGCSSGEEPYSLAILLKENLEESHLKKVKILATDINHKALEKARDGIYTEWSFRETPSGIKERYFKQSHGKWIIDGQIKKMVEFRKINLAGDIFPDNIGFMKFDMIFCRNVLMYLSSATVKNIAGKFMELLTEEGWLVVSQVELNDEYFGKFLKFSYENGIFYKKSLTRQPVQKLRPERKFAETKERKPLLSKQIHSTKRVPEKREPTEQSAEKPRKQKLAELEILYNKGKYQECIRSCISQVGDDDEKHSVKLLLAKCYANTGDYAKSVETIDKIILSGVSGEDIYYLYGTVLKEQRENKRATEALKKVLYINPNHLFSNLLLGNILSEEGKEDGASRYYRNVIDILTDIDDSHIIPESGGLTKARLNEMVKSLMVKNNR